MMRGWVLKMMGRKQKSKRTRVVLSDPKHKETKADKARRRKIVKEMQDAADKESRSNLKRKKEK